MQRARNALGCASAIATLLLVTSVTPAAGELDATSSDVCEISETELELKLAKLDLSELDKLTTKSERPTERLMAGGNGHIVLSTDEVIVGIASFYDDPQKTASGEEYDPDAFTAAAQLLIRDRFGGIQFGRLYRSAYGLGEYQRRKIIVRFNDVGPLRPGRKFDLSRAAMAYFDSSLDKGLLPDFKMTPLPLGRVYPVGPVTDSELAELGIDDQAVANAPIPAAEEPKVMWLASAAPAKPSIRKAVRLIKAKRAAVRVAAKPATKSKVAQQTAKARKQAKSTTKRVLERAAVVGKPSKPRGARVSVKQRIAQAR